MKKTLLLIFCASLLAFNLIPFAKAETVTQTRYFRSMMDSAGIGFFHIGENYTVNDSLWYMWSKTMLTTQITAKYGVRIYHVNFTDWNFFPFGSGYETYTELTSGVYELFQVNGTFEGYKSGYWNMTELTTNMLDCLYLEFYSRLKSSTGVWQNWFLFTNTTYGTQSQHATECIGMDKILNSIWNFTLYVKLERIALTVYNRLLFGSDGITSFESRIENMQFDNGISDINEIQQYEVLAILGLACGVIALGVMVVFKK